MWCQAVWRQSVVVWCQGVWCQSVVGVRVCGVKVFCGVRVYDIKV